MELRITEPVVFYRETVTKTSDHTVLAKSGNKHNRVIMIAEPLSEGLAEAIEEGKISVTEDPKVRAKSLAEKFAWDATDAKKIWCFGPNLNGPNVLVDQTKSVAYLHEVKDSVIQGFQWATKQGVLSEENMRATRINLLDMTIHQDPAHRGSPQIVPATRKAVYASALSANPRLMEPVFLVEIQCPHSSVGGVYNVLNKRRGVVVEEEVREGTPLYTVKAHLPVAESFGFTSELRAATSGQAFPQCFFDHWQVVQSDPFDKNSKAYEIIMKTRKRKGLKDVLPVIGDYEDKL